MSRLTALAPLLTFTLVTLTVVGLTAGPVLAMGTRSCELNTAGTEFVCPNGELCCADVLAGRVPPGDEQFCKFCARTEQACLAQAGFRCNVPE